MASGGQQFDDSSGERTRQGRYKNKNGAPKDLELADMHPYVTRDSGCYTGSPMGHSRPTSTASGSSAQRFMFDDMSHHAMSTPVTSIRHRHQMPSRGFTPSYALDTQLMDSGTHDDTDTAPPGGDEYGDHDEVFEMSSDESFLLDSGFQATMSPSQATPDDVRWPMDSESTDSPPHRPTPATQIFGRSKFYVPRRHSRQLEQGADTESEEEDDHDGSTTDEFNTAEFEISGSPASDPIAIPQRSNNSSPNQQNDDEDDVFEAGGLNLAGLPAAGSLGSGGSVPTPRARPLQRRQTLGDFQNLTQAESRPQSGYARLQGNLSDQLPRSLEGAHGPLPDVIPRRGRAYSESALHRSHRQLGSSLARMCDQFSEVHVNRQRTLSHMQARQKSSDVSHLDILPENKTPSANQLAGSLPSSNHSPGFLKSLQQRFFNTPPE